MPTSAAGNKPSHRQPLRLKSGKGQPPRGFTLIELLVVVALIAVATAGVTLSLRDSAADALERDAQRLAAVLESARAQSRANGAPVVWQAQTGGFVLRGLPREQPMQTWLSEQTQVPPGTVVVLSHEPLMPPQQITLYSTQPGTANLHVVTDGLRPFTVRRQSGNAS